MKLPIRIALLLALLLLSTAQGARSYPMDWGKNFTASGRTRTWHLESLFSAADFGGPGQSSNLGYEFGAILTYLGPVKRLRWYRIEPLFPEDLTIRARPNPPTHRGDCVVDIDFVADQGAEIGPGKTFTHGRCSVYPWARSTQDLAARIKLGLYLVSWEDEAGVHAEGIRLSQIQWHLN